MMRIPRSLPPDPLTKTTLLTRLLLWLLTPAWHLYRYHYRAAARHRSTPANRP